MMELKACRKDGFFVYNPDDNTHYYFSSIEDSVLYAKEIISSFYDGEWFDGVENVIVGEITHTTKKTTSIPRPPKEQIDQETGKDKNGNDWSDNLVVEICDYGLMAIGEPLSDVKAIVKEYLEKHGYDGLVGYNPIGCSCTIDDLMPCDDEANARCSPAYKTKCNGCNNREEGDPCMSEDKNKVCSKDQQC